MSGGLLPIAKMNIINVSNRLPITVKGEDIVPSSGGLVAALEGLPNDQYSTKWIGWPGSTFPDAACEQEIEKKLVDKLGYIPVFLSEAEVTAYYEGFSNSTIWPVLHYLADYLRYEPSWWESYQSVNQRFADTVLKHAKEGDLVWVHDYQLMLVPSLIKSAAPQLRVGFFLHTPFPVYEVFRCNPKSKQLIIGLLGADQIGFHTVNYLRQFANVTQRTLGIEPDLTRIRYEEHTSALGVYPIGINAPKFETTLDSPDFNKRSQELRAVHDNKRIILSVERMDYTKGILHRLDAVDYFLSRLQSTDDLHFVFVSVPSREGVEEYQVLKEEVEARVGRLNGKYSTLRNNPIHFIHGSVDFTDLCAMYAIADIGLVTPLIDGMNLVAKEFIACQRENNGLLVLSEFAGAAEELWQALLVNPYDSAGLAETLKSALAMPQQERSTRNREMRERVMKYDARHWARSFVEDLRSGSQFTATSPQSALGEIRERLLQVYSKAKHAAIFLDYDGTLREIEREPKLAYPTPELTAFLDRLSRQEHCSITIVSGRSKEDLEQWLGGYPFGLVAEHGARWRTAGATNWEDLDEGVEYAWKEDILRILRLYQEATPGTFIEEKRSSVVWHYRTANEDFGEWKAYQLAEELAALTANDLIRVRRGKKVVEVCSAQVSKGAVVAKILAGMKHYDFALCAGDDQTDETMFQLSIPELWTIKVGSGSSSAKFRVPNPAALRQLLDVPAQ